MIMALLLVSLVLLSVLAVTGWAILKELQRLRLLIQETVGETQVFAAAIPQHDLASILSQLPDIQPWREAEPRLGEKSDFN